MRAVKVLAVMLVGPLMGIVAGFVASLALLPDGPGAVVGSSPGDGFLIIGLVLLGFVVSLLISVAIAVAIGRQSSQPTAQISISVSNS